MPFRSEAQRRYLFARHPEVAKEFAAATPKGADLPERAKAAYARGSADALRQLGIKDASEELRLKIPSRTFHGYDAAHRSEGTRVGKRATAGADALAQALDALPPPRAIAEQATTPDPLNRSTAWGAPSSLAAGDAANRLGDMGQPTAVGTAF